METVVYAEIETTGCYAALFLNGIPLFSAGRGGVGLNTQPVRQYLVQRQNQLELLVEPAVIPSRARGDLRKLTLTGKKAAARLVRYPDGVFTRPENGTVLLELEWESDGLEHTYPKSFVGTVIIPEATAQWPWEDAPRLELDDATRDEAEAALAAVADTVRRGDLDAFMSLTEAKLTDCVRAYPASAPKMELRAFLDFWTKDGADPIVPLDHDAHDFRIVAGGRMLETVDRDGYASLRFRDPKDGEAIPYPLFFARIEGQLRVVR